MSSVSQLSFAIKIHENHLWAVALITLREPVEWNSLVFVTRWDNLFNKILRANTVLPIYYPKIA